MDGILAAPGLIDISNLRFVAVGDSYAGGDAFDDDEADQDGIVNQEDEGGDGDGNRRRLDNGIDDASSDTALDIAVFHLVSESPVVRYECRSYIISLRFEGLDATLSNKQ